MRTIYFAHIIAGSVGLISGYIALYTTKGIPVHRRVGMVFVVAMLAMCLAGVTLAAVRGGVWSGVNGRAALLTGYLVLTGLTTVRPFPRGGRWVDGAGALLAFSLGTVSLAFAFEAARGDHCGRRRAWPRPRHAAR